MSKGRNTLPKVGWYIYYNQEISRIISIDGAGIDVVPDGTETNDIPAVQQRISVIELFSRDASTGKVFVYAPTKKEVLARIAQLEPVDKPVHQSGVPEALLKEARVWKVSVELVDELVHDAEEHLLQESGSIQPQTTGNSSHNILKLDTYSYYEARRRYLATVYQEYHNNDDKITKTRIRELACEVLSIDISTYYRRRKAYRKYNGDFHKIAASLRRKDFEGSRQDLSILHFIDRCIMRYETSCAGTYDFIRSLWQRNRHYWIDLQKQEGANKELVELLLESKVSIDTLLENNEYRSQLKQTDSLPGLPWFYKYFRNWKKLPNNAQDYITKRYGRDVWEREYLVFDTFVHLASRPLQFVVADHLRVDVYLTDEDNRQEIYTLWLTVLIDAFTRCPIGIALLHEAPCIDSIQTALHHTIWPKVDFDDLQLSIRWLCYGIPENLSLDNAWAHHSDSLQILADNVSSGGVYTRTTFHFRRPYKARQGALIERFFRGIGQKIRDALKEAGAIDGNNRQQRLANRQKACLLYKDLYKIILKIIVEYMHTKHSELDGLTPHEKWMQAFEELPLTVVPQYSDSMKFNFYRHDTNERSINEHGISAFNLHYTSKKVQQLGRRRKGQPGEVFRISYDPDNIARIALFRNEQFLDVVYAKELLLPSGKVRDVSLAEMEVAKDFARTRNMPTSTWPEYVDVEVARLIHKRKAEKQQIEKQTLAGERASASPDDDPNTTNTEIRTNTSSPENDDYEEMKRALRDYSKR